MHDIALVRVGKAIVSQPPHRPPATAEWLVRFGPGLVADEGLHARGDGLRAVHVRIDGAAPKDLRSVRVARPDGTSSVQVDCVPVGRSGHIAAGELVLAMASQFGLAGMTIDISTMRLDAHLICVNIAVAAPSAEAAERVAVFVVAEHAP